MCRLVGQTTEVSLQSDATRENLNPRPLLLRVSYVTYSMELSPSGETNRFSATQEIPHIE